MIVMFIKHDTIIAKNKKPNSNVIESKSGSVDVKSSLTRNKNMILLQASKI